MHVIPLTLKEANDLVAQWHRHHKPVVGHRFSLGAMKDGLIGAAIVGRPVARGCNWHTTCEVTRLVTNGTKNACSFLYGACARVAKAMGFEKIQTYILEDEPGISLRAAGWVLDGVTQGGNWNHSVAYAGKRRTDQPTGPKQRYVRVFTTTPLAHGLVIMKEAHIPPADAALIAGTSRGIGGDT